MTATLARQNALLEALSVENKRLLAAVERLTGPGVAHHKPGALVGQPEGLLRRCLTGVGVMCECTCV